MSNTHVVIVWVTLAGGAMFAELARGQDYDSAGILYGDGVRAYFSGNSLRAEGALSRVLEMHPQDPRPYYFRALCLLRLGRTAEARGDMLVGAALEAQQPNRYAVGKSLERVQGYDRLMLEQFRRQARADVAALGASNGLVQATGFDDSAVLRQRVVIPLEEYIRPGVPQQATTVDASAPTPRTFAPARPVDAPLPAAGMVDDPFRDDPRPPATSPPVAPSAPPADSRPATESNESPSGGASDEAERATRRKDAEAPLSDEEDPFAP